MAISYRDRAGQPIDAAAWFRLYLGRDYGGVLLTCYPAAKIETSWVGVVSSLPGGSGLFLTRLIGLTPDTIRPDPHCLWAETEREARDNHAAMVANLREAL